MPASMLAFQGCLAKVVEEYEQLWLERSRLAEENACLRAELSLQIENSSGSRSPRCDAAKKIASPYGSEEHPKYDALEWMKDEAESTVPEDMGSHENNWATCNSLSSENSPRHILSRLSLRSDGLQDEEVPEETSPGYSREESSPLFSPRASKTFSPRASKTSKQSLDMSSFKMTQPQEMPNGVNHKASGFGRSKMHQIGAILRARSSNQGRSYTQEGPGGLAGILPVGLPVQKLRSSSATSHSSGTRRSAARSYTRGSKYSLDSADTTGPFAGAYSSEAYYNTSPPISAKISASYPLSFVNTMSTNTNKSVRIIPPSSLGSNGIESMDVMTRAVVSLVTQGKTLSFCHLKLLEVANDDGEIPRAAAVAFLEEAIRDEDHPDFTIPEDRFDEDVACLVDQAADGSLYVESFYWLLQQAWRTDWTEKRLATLSPTYNSSRVTTIRHSINPRQGGQGMYSGLPGAARRASQRQTLTGCIVDIDSLDQREPSPVVRVSSLSSETNSSRLPADRAIAAVINSGLAGSPSEGRGRLFPQWWNPPKVQIATGTELREVGSEAFDKQAQNSPSRGILSPVSSLRLCWDAIAFFFVLYEVWASPFELVFLSRGMVPETMRTLATVMLVFFAIDIVLNFNTGFVQGSIIVLQRKAVTKQYFLNWFWVDLIATFPFDRLTEEAGSNFLSSLRYVKMLKAMKIFRYIRLNKVIDTLKNTQGSFEIMIATEWIYRSVAALTVMLMLTHVNCSIWAALETDVPPVRDMQQALDWYTDVFQTTFVMILSASAVSVQTGALRWLAMVIVAERIAMAIVIFSYAVFKAMMVFEEDAQRSVRKDDTLRYLRRHNVPVKTQLQVVFALKQAARAKGMQNNFDDFLQQELPEEMRRVISEELWSVRLLTLGLIEAVAKWHVDFLPELALICREEVLASGATVFRQGEACVASYQVISGSVAIRANAGDKIPSFREGMWIGEKALVNPRFRRSASGFTETMCYLMLVPAEGFQEVLQRLELKSVFETWCAAELWLGLCGRCGTIGDHFTDACPLEYAPEKTGFGRGVNIERMRAGKLIKQRQWQMKGKWSVLGRSASLTMRDSGVNSTGGTAMSNDLQKFLHFHAIEHLAKGLEFYEVSSLEELEECDKKALRVWMLENMPDTPMTASDMAALSAKQIARFRDEVNVHIHRMLDTEKEEHQHHLIFLSHYKLEAGTEAALMRSELEALIAENKEHPANGFASPVFLDSEDLQDLKDLQEQVTNSHNVGLLCTQGVLNRPWCLVEIATAAEMGVPILPVQVDKRGNTFQFPDNNYYSQLLDGTLLNKEDQEVLERCNVNLKNLEAAIRTTFNRIAVPYSPHKAATIRRAELQTLLDQCELKSELDLAKAKLEGRRHAEAEAKAKADAKQKARADAATSSRARAEVRNNTM